MTATDLEFEFDSEFLAPDDPEPEQAEEELQDVDPSDFIEKQVESARAKKYRIKTKHGLNFLVKIFAGSPRTVSDAAAIIYHGPGVSQAVGHLCDADPKARKFVDFLTEDGIDNPYVLAGLAILPMAIQMLRNHEKGLEKGARFSIPIGRKRKITLPFTFRFRLGKMKNVSADPDFLTAHVFGNPAVQEALRAQNIRIAWPGGQ